MPFRNRFFEGITGLVAAARAVDQHNDDEIEEVARLISQLAVVIEIYCQVSLAPQDKYRAAARAMASIRPGRDAVRSWFQTFYYYLSGK